VSVGEPMFIRDHRGGDATASVERFRVALEHRVGELFMGIIHP
jgi:hypothetical protein